MASSRVPSPDGRSVAILETVDNGLGFGQGLAYDEIHVGRADLAPTVHGEPDLSVVIYAARETSNEPQFILTWQDSQHLLVTYDVKRVPHKLLRSAADVRIDYDQSGSP